MATGATIRFRRRVCQHGMNMQYSAVTHLYSVLRSLVVDGERAVFGRCTDAAGLPDTLHASVPRCLSACMRAWVAAGEVVSLSG